MGRKTLTFIALLLTALALVPALAHVLELPNKINLSRTDYLTVQQLYRGWAYLGIIEICAFLSVIVLAIAVRKERVKFTLSAIAASCVLAALAVFFVYTQPANLQTGFWSALPSDWQALRDQWEYSHAARAGLLLAALLSLFASALIQTRVACQERRNVKTGRIRLAIQSRYSHDEVVAGKGGKYEYSE